MMSSNGLPDGWRETTLGEIRVDRSTSIDPSKHMTETFELYSIPAYPSGRPEVVTGREVGSTKKSLDPGTVVVSKINPRINRVWVVGERNEHRQIGSSEWIPFFPLAGLDPKYLAYFMRQDTFRNYLAANVSGVGGSLMRVKPTTVDPYPFVLAPGPEQHRIVEAIESYFTRLDEAVATLERVQRNLKRYRASVLKAAVEGRLVPTEAELARAEGRDYEPASVLLTRILAERRRRWEEAELAKMKAKGKPPKNDRWKAKYKEPVAPDTSALRELPEGWCWATAEALSDETRSITYGVVKLGPVTPGGVPTLRSSNVRHLRLDLDYVKPISKRISDGYQRTVLHGDEVLVTVRGTLGGVVATPPTCVGFNISREVAMIAFVEPRLASLVAIFIATDALQNWIMRHTRGIAYTGINIGTLKQLPIPIPPLAEQSRIVEAVEEHLSVASATEASAIANVRRCQSLRQSILKWAFEGRLVDQDPNDEPASVLLERIRAERAAERGSKSRGSRRRKDVRA